MPESLLWVEADTEGFLTRERVKDDAAWVILGCQPRVGDGACRNGMLSFGVRERGMSNEAVMG